MSDYQLEVKQIVDYPRCRVYREFVQSLISDRNIRTSGRSGLFHYTVLCSYANFRTSYRRLDGISYYLKQQNALPTKPQEKRSNFGRYL